MLTKKQTVTLNKFLALTEEPEDTFSLDELLGYLFGLAITTDTILPDEWLPVIFGGDEPVYHNSKQEKEMNQCLDGVLGKLTADFHNNELYYPFELEDLSEDELSRLYEWVSGFEEAIALRDELWDPEQYPDLTDDKKEALYFGLMTISGIVEPMEALDFFNELPEEIFAETFADQDTFYEDRTLQIQMFLISSLPLAIDTLMGHSKWLEQGSSATGKDHAHPTKKNLIKVDFRKNRK